MVYCLRAFLGVLNMGFIILSSKSAFNTRGRFEVFAERHRRGIEGALVFLCEASPLEFA
jgi:hypothetical protein